MTETLVMLRCRRCQWPLRLVSESLEHLWRDPRCSSRNFIPIGKHGEVDYAVLSGCHRRAYDLAVRVQEEKDWKTETQGSELLRDAFDQAREETLKSVESRGKFKARSKAGLTGTDTAGFLKTGDVVVVAKATPAGSQGPSGIPGHSLPKRSAD